MNDFNFDSSACTSVEQSRRLINLGINKHTADCHYPYSIIDGTPIEDKPNIGSPSEQAIYVFPAWSLNRLILLYCDDGEIGNGSIRVNIEDPFNHMIDLIESGIKNKCIKKEYLDNVDE